MNVCSNSTRRLQPSEPFLSLPPVLSLGHQVEAPLRVAVAAARVPRARGVKRGAAVSPTGGGTGGCSSGGSQGRKESAQPARRTCAGCGGEAVRDELVRCVLDPGGEGAGRVVVDLRGKLAGRGSWVHPRHACFEQAARRGLARSFRQRVDTSCEDLLEQLRLQANRRLHGLLLSARARGCLVFGLDTVKHHAGQASLVLVSEDARALTKDRVVQQWAQSGKVTLWSTKQEYGHLLGRVEVGILAVLDAAIATAITRTISLTRLRAPAQSAGGDAHLLSEVR